MAIISTSPPVSPSPDEVSQERGRIFERGLAPPLGWLLSYLGKRGRKNGLSRE
jgi:hypothetical protein